MPFSATSAVAHRAAPGIRFIMRLSELFDASSKELYDAFVEGQLLRDRSSTRHSLGRPVAHAQRVHLFPQWFTSIWVRSK